MQVYIDVRNRFAPDETWAVREWGGDWKVLSAWFPKREDAVNVLKEMEGVKHHAAADRQPAKNRN